MSDLAPSRPAPPSLRRRSSPRLRTTVAAAGLAAALAGGALLTAGTAAADAWCRVDDPGHAEMERSKRGLGRSEMSQIPCPKREGAETLPEELALPMPCGRFMVFRRVTVPAAHLLDHKAVYLGGGAEASGDAKRDALSLTMSGQREDVIAGAFTRSAGKGRFERSYYIGKYEVTGVQFALFTSGALPDAGAALSRSGGGQGDDAALCSVANGMAEEVRGASVLPAVGINWHDAVRFANAYSEWLLAGDRARIAAGKRPELPWEEGATGFLRLPTEVEWEFAARGGEASESALQSRRTYSIRREDGSVDDSPPMPDIASFTSATMAPPDGSQVMYVARGKPNLLGLYDMVGNTDEIVFDLFRPTRQDAMAGQAGGFVVRGGNATQPEAALGVGARREVPFYDQRGPVRAAFTGFRLVISAPVFMGDRDQRYQVLASNPERDQWLVDARTILSKTPEGVGREELQRQFEELKKLNDQGDTNNEALRHRIEQIQVALERSNAELNERNRHILRQKFTSMLMMVNAIDNADRRIYVARDTIKRIEETASSERDPARKSQLLNAAKEGSKRIQNLVDDNKGNFKYYIEMIKDMAKTNQVDVNQARSDADDDFRSRRLQWYERARPITDGHLAQARSQGGQLSQRDISKWFDEIPVMMNPNLAR